MKTRITELLGIEQPIFQAAMSWASSNAPLVVAVSNAGGMGVLGAGPLRPEDFKAILREIKAGTKKPYGVNIPLNGKHAQALLQIAAEEKIPVMVASQTGSQGISWWSMAALSFAAILPLIILGIALERYLIKGMTAGAVK